MAMRPVLGIMCCNRVVGTEAAQAVMDRYVRAAMRYADVAALLIPATPELMQPEEIIARVDGILLTGSPSNVGARHYGEDDGDGPFDPSRDAMALGLIKAALKMRTPLFGICRGLQEINVALGGTLRRDTSVDAGLISHHAPDHIDFGGMFDHKHPVSLSEGGVLATAYAKRDLVVNSVHFQGIGKLSPLLSVEAIAPDGLPEAISATIDNTPVLAVQWHPEWNTDKDDDSQTFFKLLGDTLRATMRTS
ncbi:MAG: gamma-glutamyl-gamma-aminobutyrate hydrolase family protein [Sphingomonadaceae bacterium]